jgi:hypothetical protein
VSTIRDQFIADIETFLATRGMNATDFGLQAMNDGSFVHQLRRGRDVKVQTIEKVRAFMQEFGKNTPRSARGSCQEVAAA